jgi:hypothetical protein
MKSITGVLHMVVGVVTSVGCGDAGDVCVLTVIVVVVAAGIVDAVGVVADPPRM